MRNQKKRRGGPFSGGDWQRYLRFLAVPLIVVILILVIVLADRKPEPAVSAEQTEETAGVSGDGEEPSAETDESEESSSSEDSGETESEGETESQTEEAPAESTDDSGLKRSDIPEITALMEEYCAAKVSCDAEAMYRIYGRTDMTGVEELRQRMQYRARYVEDIDNVASYILPGMEDNSYIVYVTADIKFRVTDTLAPTIMWCYVRMEDDGTWHIVENMTAEEAEYAVKAEQSDGVRQLAEQVDQELEAAIASDTRLASAYGILREGTTVPDSAQTAGAQTETSAGGESSSAQ